MISKKFVTQSNAIASYDYFDIASGLGYETFYVLVTKDAATQYSLQPNNLNYSGIRETTQSGIGTTTLTFDSSEFNLPRTINGTAYFSFGVHHNLAAIANTYKARLYKWDGSSATAITSEKTITVGLGVIETIYSFEMPCTQTLIKKGEQLRLIITMTIPAGGTGTDMSIGHDPQNMDGTNISPSTQDTITSTRINIPFKLTDI